MRKIVIDSDLVIEHDNEPGAERVKNVIEELAKTNDEVTLCTIDFGDNYLPLEDLQNSVKNIAEAVSKHSKTHVVFIPIGKQIGIKDIKCSTITVKEINDAEENNRQGKTKTT